MREAAFLRINAPRWERFEELLEQPRTATPDQLADLFIQVTDDLAYARTTFPDSQAAQYLNGLAQKVHRELYRNKGRERGALLRFWRDELPLLLYEVRRDLLYALIIFLVSVGIALFSSTVDESYVRTIMGDAYVDMTTRNIREGRPFGVYASESQGLMFISIVTNNLRVMFNEVAAGILTPIGTGYFIFVNGTMVGGFYALIANQGQAEGFFLVVLLHGAIELSALVIAGAAGFTLGRSLIFPGTLPRMVSLQRGAMRALKIAGGLLPFIIIAALIESYVTRYGGRELPTWGSFLIVLGSVALVLWYFVLYPSIRHREVSNVGNAAAATPRPAHAQ